MDKHTFQDSAAKLTFEQSSCKLKIINNDFYRFNHLVTNVLKERALLRLVEVFNAFTFK